jgi:hypothetical protein
MSEDHDLIRRSRRLLAELVVIAAGVFLGLAGDAAWDSRQERAAERGYLTDLRAEMLLASDELAQDLRRRARWVAQTDSILSQIEQRTAPDSALTLWLQESTMQLSTYRPPEAVLNDLVSSGHLGVLRSDELRYALLTYQQNVGRMRFLEEWATAAAEDALRPYLTTHAAWIRGFGNYRPHSITPSAWQQMLSDPVFENLMSISLQRRGWLVVRTEELSEIIEEILSLIDGELERDGLAP